MDWRGLSYYGGMACRTYFCPSVRHLPARWLNAVRRSLDHWYLHGLIVTERQLLAAFFVELENRLGRRIGDSDFSDNSGASECFKAFARLKIDWPFRRQHAPGVCNYFFEDGQYHRPALKRTTAAICAAPLEKILQELDSGFSSTTDVQAAQEQVEDIFRRLVAKLKGH